MALDKPYADVPGTTIFDAEQARKGYHLNMFCMSLMKAPNRERFRGARLKSANSGNDIEPRPHGSLRIVFVRGGIAKIGQYPIAPKLGEEAVIGSRDTGAGGVIGIDHGAHVFRIEAGR